LSGPIPFFQHDLGEPELDAVREVLRGPILTTGATVERDGYSALERSAVGQRESGHAPGPDLLLEIPAGPPVDRGGPRLSDAHVHAGHLGVIESVEQDEMPPVVHHRDHHADAASGAGRRVELIDRAGY